MRHNTVKEKINRGEPSFGIWLADGPSPARIEFYGRLGFEFVIIDTEHLSIRQESLVELVRACDVVGVVPIVRPPNHAADTILSYLDMGVLGLYFCHVQSAEDARTIVDRVKYAPIGSRSAALARSSDWGLTQSPKDYFKQANDETMIILLLEDVAGIQNVDEILKVKEVDVVTACGASDLSHSMGYIGERDHPEVVKAIKTAEEKIVAAGGTFDCEPENAQDAREAIARGARLIPFYERPMLRTLFGGVLRESLSDAAQLVQR